MPSTRPLLVLLTAAVVSCFAAGCQQTFQQAPAPPDTRAADAAAIQKLDNDWFKAAAAKDLDTCASYYLDDAVIFSPGVPAVVGKGNIRKFLLGMVSAPNMKLTFLGSTVDVARSGDLAMDHGTVQVTTTDKKGKTVTRTSQAILVWKKQPDGSWKVAADTSAANPT
jgi:uncharacterized protein (TIGR02246 family)